MKKGKNARNFGIGTRPLIQSPWLANDLCYDYDLPWILCAPDKHECFVCVGNIFHILDRFMITYFGISSLKILQTSLSCSSITLFWSLNNFEFYFEWHFSTMYWSVKYINLGTIGDGDQKWFGWRCSCCDIESWFFCIPGLQWYRPKDCQHTWTNQTAILPSGNKPIKHADSSSYIKSTLLDGALTLAVT